MIKTLARMLGHRPSGHDGQAPRLSPSHPRGIRRVQVGCGPHNIMTGWWNVDIQAFPGIDQAMDAAAPWPWRDQLDYVYGEHFLEHLQLAQAVDFLQHAGQALKPGGRIRLSTPSLEWVLKTHFIVDEPSRHLQQTYDINRAFHGWGHRFLYSQAFLRHLIESLGFEDIGFHDYGRSNDPELCDLERHGGLETAFGYPSVWVIEARRGERPILASAQLRAAVHENLGQFLGG